MVRYIFSQKHPASHLPVFCVGSLVLEHNKLFCNPNSEMRNAIGLYFGNAAGLVGVYNLMHGILLANNLYIVPNSS